MYDYSDFDRAFVDQRIEQFRSQITRRINGALREEEFKPLRLMNGVYLQLHAYMLRVAIPYGTMNSTQMRKLAEISERWDKGYGHFTTRQNIQFNWPALTDIPDMLEALAEVDMHAIQTSGNCVRNVTADHFAGAAADEISDPRASAELLRQWSTDHPEFAFLGRKFKLAVSGSPVDRAVLQVHDIGLQIIHQNGAPGYRVLVGGGLGRTPMLGKELRAFLPEADLLPYVEAVLQVFNMLGRRENKYKARIKFAVHEHGLAAIQDKVEACFIRQREKFTGADRAIYQQLKASFAPPDFVNAPIGNFTAYRKNNPAFRSFTDTNLSRHRAPGYTILTVSLKAHGQTPGDASAEQMRRLADLAEQFSHNELRISHEQNVILPHVHKSDLAAVYDGLRTVGLATANVGLASDIIACPGMDYCALATARSIPLAQQIATRLQAREQEIGALKIKISGCINACGHHHLGHIGILGLEKSGRESYQITLGGEAGAMTTIGERAGPGFSHDQIIPAMERLIETYLALRNTPEETFVRTYHRLGKAPFKAALYPEAQLTAEQADAF
jgi:sulfite reductase (NADPH) hemoprotein beta-component